MALYMIIEDFTKTSAREVYARFEERGRLMPPGLEYVNSWVDLNLERCFQVVACERRADLEKWINNWRDLVGFEVIPVMTSQQAYQASRATGK